MLVLCAILAGIPRLPGAACRGRHELYDEIPRCQAAISGPSAAATRPRHGSAGVARHGPRARRHRLPLRCRRPDRSGTRLAELGKRARRSQGNRWSGAIFRKITGSGQIGHLHLRVCRARVITCGRVVRVHRRGPCRRVRLTDQQVNGPPVPASVGPFSVARGLRRLGSFAWCRRTVGFRWSRPP
jgi:hypothetical protein